MSSTTVIEPGILASEPSRAAISWGAIVGGIVAAVATHIALSELCLACGLALYEPFSADAPEASTIAWTTVIAGVITTIISLAVGGWIAGRLTNAISRPVTGLHGLLVWASASLLVTALVATAVGSLAGWTAKAVGSGIAQAAGGAAQALPEAARMAAPSWDSIRNEIEQGAQRFRDQPGKPMAALSEHGRLMELLGNAFSTDRNGPLPESDRQEIIGLLSAQLGLSNEEASRSLDQWQRTWRTTVERYETAKSDATERAKQLALAAKRHTAQAAMAGFSLMVIGAISAFLGALYGHACRFPGQRRTTHPIGTAPTGAHA
jgi:hypothetical protein